MPNLRFLVISLGNPAPYAETLHSAGHHALAALQGLLRDTQPRFSSERHGRKSCLTSVGPKYTLLQSPTLMNVSGPWVARAWREILESQPAHVTAAAAAAATESGAASTPSSSSLALILVHDDLEEELGVVRTRKWAASHRGHNGVKSVNESLRHADFKDARWARISVGIGRPGERDRGTVSEYVLRPVTRLQKDTLHAAAGLGVLRCLEELEGQWGRSAKGKRPPAS